MQTQHEGAVQSAREGESHIAVVVITTSGTYPLNGTDEVPVNQPVRVVLEKAQRKLDITDTAGWIVAVGNTVIDASKSYADNGLKGSVKLDWGPKEGGGGKGVGPDA